MKKIIFTFSILTVFLLAGCKSNDDEKGFTKYNNVKSLFVINQTDYDRQENNSGVELKIRERAATYEETDSEIAEFFDETFIEIPVKSPTFQAENLKLKASRAAEVITKTDIQEFSVGQYHNFQTDWELDSYLNTKKAFRCVYESEYCYVWTFPKEAEESKATDEEIEVFAKKFDQLYLKETALCGPKYYGTSVFTDTINPNKKISILLYDIGNDKEKQYYWGYVSPSDLFDNNDSVNGMELIHIDSYALKHNPNAIFSTLAHEFNHMLNFVNKTLKYGISYESWYTEMISMLVEDFLYEDIGITAIDSSQARLMSFVQGSYIYGFMYWPQGVQIENYKYSNAYAFGAYLTRNYGGAKLVHEICTNEYVNEESVVNAVNKVNGTNKTFNDLLKEFPLILVNIDNQDSSMPSLNISNICTLDGFEYKLTPIHPDLFKEYAEANGLEINILSIRPDAASLAPLYAYGFHYYNFSPAANIALKNDYSFLTVVK